MVNLPTRENNILDLVITTNITIVNILPGISDHNVHVVEIKSQYIRKDMLSKPRTFSHIRWQTGRH